MSSQVDYVQENAVFFDRLSTPGQEKYAADALNDFTRLKIRETSFARRVIPPFKIDRTELDPQVDTDKPAKIFEREPNSPAAMSLPFGTTPTMFYIRGPRYRVLMDRIMSPRMAKDTVELQSYRMDIRQVLADNMIKDMLSEEDSKFIAGINTVLVGADQVVPTSGVAQWRIISGGMNRTTWAAAKKIMPQAGGSLEAGLALMNNVTVKTWETFGRDEMGGDWSQDILREGFSSDKISGIELLITIKRALVPDDSTYLFAAPEYIGKMLMLEDTTVYVKHEAMFIDSFAYQVGGGSIANTNGLVRVDFA